jgi:hypothetical protein
MKTNWERRRRGRTSARPYSFLAIAVLAPACESPPTEPVEGGDPALGDLPTLLLELDPDELDRSPAGIGSTPVRTALFVGVGEGLNGFPEVDAGAAAWLIEGILDDADDVLEQCGLHLEVQAAHVVGLPLDLLDIAGNREGSFGGHPPEGTADPDRFNYDRNERLTPQTRELFAYGKRFTHPNAIGAFTVRSIEYWTGDGRTAAGGLSFSPNAYHHPDDHPLRNSVLLVPRYPRTGALPEAPRSRVLAHELAHMLLNTGLHDPDLANLLGSGDVLRADQCDRMLEGLDRLFGEDAVPDPGRPGEK